MPRKPESAWEVFKADPRPLAKIKELQKALVGGPGLPSLYREAKERRTVLGVPVLAVGKNLFLSRQRVIDRVEGRDGQPEV